MPKRRRRDGAVRVHARLVNLRKLASPHWLLLVVLAAGALLRIAVAVAYRPGLFYSDSWDYIDLAYGSPIVGVSVQHPFGYPLLLHGLALVQRSLTTITTTQHLAGLIGGVVLYAILVRLRVSRTLSALAVAVVLLDIYVVTLEQYILSEAFFGLTLLGSAYFAIRGERRTAELAASGLLLAVATSLRTAALFAVPAWLGYLLWTRRGLRGVVAAALALTLPLLAYATYSARGGGSFSVKPPFDGIFLYGRVAELADCHHVDVPAVTRPLCGQAARFPHRTPSVWIFGGPVVGLLGRGNYPAANKALRTFARATILERPGAYASLVLDDSLGYFTPGVTTRDDPDVLLLPAGPTPVLNVVARDKWEPGFRPAVHAPSSFLRGYQRWLHTPRWLLAVFVLAGLLSLASLTMKRWRSRLTRRPEVFLLLGAGLSILIGSTATTTSTLRYLIPVVPLLTAGGVLALVDLSGRAPQLPGRRPQPSTGASEGPASA